MDRSSARGLIVVACLVGLSCGGTAETLFVGGPSGAGGQETDATPESSAGAGGSVPVDASADTPDQTLVPDTPLFDSAIDTFLESGTEAGCGPNTKLCSSLCVAVGDPNFGCTPSGCTPCVLAQASPGCSNGACLIASCLPGYLDCDQSPVNGCEISGFNDPYNCGACGHVCSNPSVPMPCQQGKCVGDEPCAAGFAECDGDPTVYCETNVVSDLANCGACGHVCAAPHAVPLCKAAKCILSSCVSGYGDCNANEADGCEALLDSDPMNCGSCGTICGTGSCVAGSCQTPSSPVVLATGGTMPFDIALDATSVYWSSSSGIAKVAKTGGTSLLLATAAGNGIALDSQRVYFADDGPNSIRSVPLAGGATTTLASGLGYAWRVATDGVMVFFPDNTAGTISAVPVLGGAITLLATGQSGPAAIAVSGSMVYWTNAQGGTVVKAPVAGGSITTLASGETQPIRIALDATYYYFTTHDANGTLKRGPIAGGPVTLLLSGLAEPIGVAVDSSSVYWTEKTTVKRMPLGGGPVAVIAASQANPNSIAVDGTRVYWTNYGDGTVMAASK